MNEIIIDKSGDDLSGRFLTFHIGSSVYGLALLHVIEIIKVQPTTGVPNVPSYIKGVINLRGKIVPVIDVRLKFDMEELDYNEKTCIIVVDIRDMQVGLIVDSVSEVVTVENENLSAPPEFGSGGANNRYLSSIAQIGERIILNIDCDKFFSSDLSASIF